MALLRLYSTPIALALWALVWTAGVRGDAVIIVALALVALTAVVGERERGRRRRGRR